MNITTSKKDEFTIVNVDGRIDTSNYNQFENEMNKLIADGVLKIIIDCSNLNYISSSGLRILLIVHKKLTASNGDLRLSSLRSNIYEVLAISGFTSIFKIYSHVEEALAN